MQLSDLLGLLGGLALFLYGMQMMSDGLENAAGDKMKQILEKLTSNRFLGVAVGACVTAIIQSSSATTVMVVGFVNSGMMTLRQAVWIIMGANIGTTITGQLVALDVGELAPLFAFIGVAAIVFMKKPQIRYFGSIIAGLGVLFIGMDMMSAAMAPLKESEAFISLMTSFSNPIFGILGGAVFTAVIQSSSASVGILQTLANNGLITFQNSVFVLFGQNIGTCITAALAAIGTGTNAKRTTIIHLSFNIIGTCIFTITCLLFPIADFVGSWTPNAPASQIANMHTTFNIVTTLLLLPVGEYLTKLAILILKDKEEVEDSAFKVQYLLDIKHINAEKLGASLVCMEGIKKETLRMLDMAKVNVHQAFSVFAKRDDKKYSELEAREEYIDYLNKEISKYITKAMSRETTRAGSQMFNSLYSVTSNIERISDHATNIAGYSNMITEKGIHFSEFAQAELVEIQQVCDELFILLVEKPNDIIDWHKKIACMEQKIDDLTVVYRNNMFERIQKGSCSDEGSILFSEMLTDFERIGDHALNISDEMLKIEMAEGK